MKPDFAFGFNNRGNALHALGRHDEALDSFGRAIALEPDYSEAHNNRGNALLDLNRPAEALADYERGGRATSPSPSRWSIAAARCAISIVTPKRLPASTRPSRSIPISPRRIGTRRC